MRSWGPHPDVAEPLKKMGEHYKLVILSNADDSFLEESVPRLGADFHAVYTAEQAGYYKPRYGAFEYMLDQLDAQPEDFVHVSSHTRYDPMPMHDMGFRNLVLLDRGYDPVPPGYDLTVGEVPRRAQHPARHLSRRAERVPERRDYLLAHAKDDWTNVERAIAVPMTDVIGRLRAGLTA